MAFVVLARATHGRIASLRSIAPKSGESLTAVGWGLAALRGRRRARHTMP